MSPAETRCNLCSDAAAATATTDAATGPGPEPETALVRCNVRAFKDERFRVWRCAKCLSVHSADEVDLAHYYAKYPFHVGKLNWLAIFCYDNMLRRLQRAGLRKTHRILDYGCGGGLFVEYLRRRGYKNTVGYDAYSPQYRDPAVLDAKYDCIVSQDVIEHAPDPVDLMRQFGRLAAPNAILSIGTPNAEAIDLAHPDDFVHTLHQPYHVHILSKRALLATGQSLGWRLDRYYPKQYSNLLLPGLNQRFFLLYVKYFDDTIDVVFEGAAFKWALLSPKMLLLAFFGWFFSLETDVMAVFRAPS